MSVIGATPGGSIEPVAAGLRALRLHLDSPVATWRAGGAVLGTSDASSHFVCDDVHVLLDGRIDNRAALVAGPDGASVPAAHVVFLAWRRWGADFADRLVGDFAVAVWDGRNRRLLLARDASGHRPLHYWIRGDELRFASEARALLAASDIPLVIDELRVAQWLVRCPPDAGATFFQGIRAVSAGHTVTFQDGRVTLNDFWKPAARPMLRLKDPREYAEGLRSVLTRAVADRIEAPARAASHLSGGLDSSSVTATAAKLLADRGDGLVSFTAVPAIDAEDAAFPGRFCDERSHASATARRYASIDHQLVPNYAHRLFPVLDRMSSAMEAPQLNPGNSLWFYRILVEAQRQQRNVLLTGACGNFTISYDGRRALGSLIGRGRLLAARRLALSLRRQHAWSWAGVISRTSRPFLPAAVRQMLDEIAGRSAVGVEQAAGVRPAFARGHGLTVERALEHAEPHDGRRLRIWCLRRYDPGGIVAAARRMTDVELTDPTTDRRVMDYCLAIPEEHFARDGVPRSLIRDAMAGALPEQVLRERRIGRQSADLVWHLSQERHEIAAEFKRLERHDLAARCLDLPRMQDLLRRWPADPNGAEHYHQYGIQMMRALSMGRFLRRVEDGTFFTADYRSVLP